MLPGQQHLPLEYLDAPACYCPLELRPLYCSSEPCYSPTAQTLVPQPQGSSCALPVLYTLPSSCPPTGERTGKGPVVPSA
jgi:hypothetical protein